METRRQRGLAANEKGTDDTLLNEHATRSGVLVGGNDRGVGFAARAD
jgi:hypothetical protein